MEVNDFNKKKESCESCNSKNIFAIFQQEENT